MRYLKTFVATLTVLAMCAGGALAAQPATEGPNAAGIQQDAIFSVPKLARGGVLKNLAKALADHPGIVVAQADSARQNFVVTFDKHRTSPDQILKVVSSVSKEARLVSVAPTDPKAAAAHDCGKCPQARTCPSMKKK